MSEAEKIYNLDLHESINIQSNGKDATTYFQVMRVADGWIYTYWDSELQQYSNNGVFVPFDNRFQGT